MKVAFVGPAGSGKSLACRILVEKYGGTKVSFANAVKQEVFEFLQDIRQHDTMKIMDLHPKAYLHPKRPNIGYMSLPPLHCPEPLEWINYHKGELRPLLQWWGGDFRRVQDKEYWIKKVKLLIEQNQNVFIDDCRYLNEAEFLQKAGFELIGIQPAKLSEKVDHSHSSESELYDIWKFYETPIIKNDQEDYTAYEQAVLEMCG